MKSEQQKLIERATISYHGIVNRELWGGQRVYKYILHIGGKTFSWFCGLGIDKRPTVEQILGDLARDWRDARDCGDLENFLLEFGYNESSENIKRGKKIFARITDNNARLAGLGFSLPDIEQYIQD